MSHRSEITIDLGALRGNVRRMRRAAARASLWAVVKADAYGHGATTAGRVALEEGAAALCVATVGEALPLRSAFPDARLIVLGPSSEAEYRSAREAALELVWSVGPAPAGVPVHLKLDTGMGRWGAPRIGAVADNVVGLISHLATADTDLSFAREQLARFRALTSEHTQLERSLANSAATLRLPSSHFDAVRCGIALYGLSPFGTDPAEDDLQPVLSWRSQLAQVRRLGPGESTGYGRRYVASRETWIGVVPVGYADGFRRGLTGTEVLVDGERRPVVGTVSMDCFAVDLGQAYPVGAPVTVIGDGLLAEEHAQRLDTITYELVSRLETGSARARRIER